MKKLKNKGFTLVEVIVVLVILAVLAAVSIPSMLGFVNDSKEKVCDINRMDITRLYETSVMGGMDVISSEDFEEFVIENWGTTEICPSGGTYTYTTREFEGQAYVSIDCSVHDGVDDHMETIAGNLSVLLDGADLEYQRWNDDPTDTSSWSRKLEMFLQDEDDKNFYDYENTLSGSTAILNWDSVYPSYKNPAVFITNDDWHDIDNEDLYGSIIFYKTDNNSSEINYYSVDAEGNRSQVETYNMEE